ncbi:3-hydroxyacyl-CoA dehydrogenase family protein [Paenisporosarcina sp. TG20]|uniref:3-hydroxyacyl-CoA dehydrogenase family protein n=1 Tax=Paenisporosarcina sp. TG20 TaxID=1211706 RepID=UPI0002F1C6C5|nr:3-hydroxyacyl-CoA dehydrogenase family protein [Paenisporosarcina sp. TG20]
MTNHKISNISVIGAGQMGHQIAMLCALGGFETINQDINGETLNKAKEDLDKLMNQWVKKGKITEDEKSVAFSKLTFTQSLEEAAMNADFVIEAVVEKLEVKREIFRQLDKLASKHTIFATNSSTIVNSMIAEVTSRPAQVCNMHFFFPPLVMDCVEVVMSDNTSDQTAQVALAVCEQMNRTGVLLRKEISGFVANRILGASQKEAMNLYEDGIADFRDIDFIVKKALGHRIGPFELMDLSGIDVVQFVMEQRYAETGNSADKPPIFITEKVKSGLLGRKTGEGFYQYSKESIKNDK